MPTGNTQSYDVVFAGGGLACTLMAVRLRAAHPHLRLLVIERASTLGAGHTWSFHTPDIDALQYDWLQPFITHTWPDQQLKFPEFSRVVDVGYNTVTSVRFDTVAMERIGDAVRLDTGIATVASDHVVLEDGERIDASCVIDGRGLQPGLPLALGYQKFLGLEIRTREPHGEIRPTIMDATVSQNDGYRFVYTLPFDPHRILIEDTYYSDGDNLSQDALRERILEYAADRGWIIEEIEREENGVLPIVLGGDIDGLWKRDAPAFAQPARVGLRAALFHPTTGYSLPDAVRLADEVTALDRFDTMSVTRLIERRSRAAWRARRYYRLLNRMLFKGAMPDERVGIFQHFYRLSTGTIERFYAGRLNPYDKARILIGRPPIPIVRALPCVPERSVWPRT